MTTKAAFNAEEWTVVTTAPALAALWVAAADKGGSVRESIALSRAYAQERAEDHSPLLKEIVATAPTLGPGTNIRNAEDLRREAPPALSQAVATLERLAHDSEVVEYKRFVYRVAETVARAHREGGVLGIGGTQISAAEQAVLDEITAIFDRVHYTG
jgi:hypothetical protein